MTIPHLHSPATVSYQVAWKSLAKMIQLFRLNEEEACCLMGDMPRSTYYKGLKTHEGKLARDQLERISYLLGIYKALRILFTDTEQAMTWIDRPNSLPPFNGVTPRKYMLQGNMVRLAEVRRCLDFWRG